MDETHAPDYREPPFNINNPSHWDPPPYVREHPRADIPALRALPPKARVRRVVEIVAARNPNLAPDGFEFGRLVSALTGATDHYRRNP